MKLSACAWVSFLLAAGCHSPPLWHHSTSPVNIPFEYGTNAVLQFQASLKEAGGYDLYLILEEKTLPRAEDGRSPLRLDTNLRVLLWTDGQTATARHLTSLPFIGSDKDHAAYYVSGLKLEVPSTVKCEFWDLSNGAVRARGFLRLRHSVPK